MADYTPTEMMTIAAARALRNERCLLRRHRHAVGGGNLARLTHAPDITLIYESGTLGTKPDVLPLSIGDGELCETALTTVSVPEMFRYWLQGGRITVGFLGGAQIDSFANLNTTVVGAYDKPKVRLPGGGGAPEIATSCGEIFIIMAQGKRSFVPKLDFVTSLGHGEGGDARAARRARPRARPGSSPISAIFEPDPAAKEMTVTSIHPGVTREQIADNTGWPVRFADDVERDAGADRARAGSRCASCTPAPRAPRRSSIRRSTMPEAFICDGMRTPIGRYGGALAKVRTDDLAAVPIKALMERHPNVDWSALDEVYLRLRQPGRRGQPQRRAHGAAAGRAAGFDPGHHRQPALRVRAQCGGRRGAGDPRRRDRLRHRRRRRIDDARAVRHGQGAGGVPAQRRDRTTPPSAGASSIR